MKESNSAWNAPYIDYVKFELVFSAREMHLLDMHGLVCPQSKILKIPIHLNMFIKSLKFFTFLITRVYFLHNYLLLFFKHLLKTKDEFYVILAFVWNVQLVYKAVNLFSIFNSPNWNFLRNLAKSQQNDLKLTKFMCLSTILVCFCVELIAYGSSPSSAVVYFHVFCKWHICFFCFFLFLL